MARVAEKLEREKGKRASSKIKAPPRPKSVQPRRPSYRTGRDTHESILRAAEKTLVEHGYSGFTLKKVAAAAGIAKGNLHYHFPTKDVLLEWMMDRTLADYSIRVRRVLPSLSKSGPRALEELVGWFIDDSTTARYIHVFRELWAAALHTPSLNKALEHFYDRSIADVLLLIDLPPSEMRREKLEPIVQFICVISEGAAVLHGGRKDARESLAQLKSLARAAVAHLLRSTAR